MTTELQTDRYDKILRRTGGIIGPGSKVAEVLTELFPMFDVENLPAELYLLGGTKLGFGGGFQRAVAAQAGRAQLFNPADSGVIATLTSVIVSRGGAGPIRWGLRGAAIAVAIDTQLLRDRREVLPTQPIVVVRSDTSATLANATGQVDILNNTAFILTDANGLAVLPPGQGFEIGNETVNADFRFVFYWRERPALDSELNLP